MVTNLIPFITINYIQRLISHQKSNIFRLLAVLNRSIQNQFHSLDSNLSTMSEASAPVVTFKKGPSRRPAQSRQRRRSPSPLDPVAEASASASGSSVIRPEKKSLANPLVQGTKRRRTSANNEEGEDGVGGGLDELDYAAEGGLTRKGDELATRANDWDLEDEDGQGKRDKKVRLDEVRHALNSVCL